MKTLPRKRKNKNSYLPPEFRDSPIFRSKKGKLGSITVRRFTGVMKNSAARTIMQFEKNMGDDKEAIATLLESASSLSTGDRKLIELLRDPENSTKSLARLIAEAKTEAAGVIQKCSKGALLLGQAAAYVQIGMAMPKVVRELRRHIQPRNEICMACQGKGKVPRSSQEKEETQICPVCKGEGGTLTSSDKMQFAVEKLIEMSKMGKQPSGPMVAVQTTNNTLPSLSISGLMEKVVGSTSSLLFQKKDPLPQLTEGNELPIDAQLVEKEEDVQP